MLSFIVIISLYKINKEKIVILGVVNSIILGLESSQVKKRVVKRLLG